MSNKLKKEKIDIHPERVQNPFDKLKRSPGKFDQKVFMEQDLYGENVNKFYRRIYNTQQHVQMTGFDKKIAELRRRGTELKTQSEEITYLNALRTALRKEKEKRENEIYQPVEKNLQSTTAVTAAIPAKVDLTKDMNSRTELSEEIPAADVINTVAKINEDSGVQRNMSPEADYDTLSQTTSSDYSIVKKKTEKAAQEKRVITPNRLATLEKMSFEIMTNTLPVQKLKRIIPEEQLPVHEKWPILSNYRKKKVLPSVKEGKQQLAEDMSDLHERLNKYFNCDNFPLSQYKYVAKAHPRKYRLLKAIETENLSLPVLPR